MSQKEIARGSGSLGKDVRALKEAFLSFREERGGFSELRGMFRRRGLDLFPAKSDSAFIFSPAFAPKKNRGFTNSLKNIPFVSSSGRS